MKSLLHKIKVALDPNDPQWYLHLTREELVSLIKMRRSTSFFKDTYISTYLQTSNGGNGGVQQLNSNHNIEPVKISKQTALIIAQGIYKDQLKGNELISVYITPDCEEYEWISKIKRKANYVITF
jgi:hypothetical protein